MSRRLVETQRAFLSALVGPADDLGWVGQPDAARRVAIYRNAVEHNWRAAMQSVYPVCEAWVGPAFFNEAVRRHLAQSPSVSGDLHDLGGGFAAFLGDYPPAASQPMLPDLARLEWALHRAFHAADGRPIPLASLAEVSPEDLPRLVLRLLPGTALVFSEWPVLDIWKSHQPGNEAHTFDLSAAERSATVIWREGFETALSPLGAAEACLVDLALAGQPLLESLRRPPFEEAPAPDVLLGESLRTLFELGLVGGLETLKG